MFVVLEVSAQPTPSDIVCRGELGHRSGPKLRVPCQEGHNLDRIHVSDGAQAPPPRIAVAIRRQQVPPQLHLNLEGGLHRLQDVLAVRCLGCVINVPRILLGIPVVASGRNRIVGIQGPAGELLRRSVQNIVHVGTARDNAKLIADGGDTRSHPEIVFREIDYPAALAVIEAPGVQKRTPGLLFLRRQTLPHRVAIQVGAEVA